MQIIITITYKTYVVAKPLNDSDGNTVVIINNAKELTETPSQPLREIDLDTHQLISVKGIH